MIHSIPQLPRLSTGTPQCPEKLEPCKLGLPKEFFGEGMDDEVRKAIDQAIAWYKEQGYEMVEISLPTTDLSVPVYYIVPPLKHRRT